MTGHPPRSTLFPYTPLFHSESGGARGPPGALCARRDSAFARLPPAEVDWPPGRRARLVHLTGITPALSASARALSERALAEAAAVSFDLNYRAALWSPSDARAYAETVLPRARFVFTGLEEARTVFGLDGPAERIVEALSRQAPKATVSLLMGEDGSVTFDGGRIVRPRPRPRVEGAD